MKLQRSHLTLAPVLFTISLVACGDDAAHSDGGAGGEDVTTLTGATKTSSNGPSSTNTATADTNATTGASTSSSPPDDRLDPLEVGRSWTYDVESTYPSCPAGTRTTTVDAAVTVDGRSAFEVTSICGDTVAISVEGNVVESKYQSYPWLRLLDEPVADGHSWMTTNGAATFGMTYTSVGSVATPAGTFDDCWRVTQEVSYTQTWTYCAGVGQVSSELVDLAGGVIRYELTAKSF